MCSNKIYMHLFNHIISSYLNVITMKTMLSRKKNVSIAAEIFQVEHEIAICRKCITLLLYKINNEASFILLTQQ